MTVTSKRHQCLGIQTHDRKSTDLPHLSLRLWSPPLLRTSFTHSTLLHGEHAQGEGQRGSIHNKHDSHTKLLAPPLGCFSFKTTFLLLCFIYLTTLLFNPFIPFIPLRSSDDKGTINKMYYYLLLLSSNRSSQTGAAPA